MSLSLQTLSSYMQEVNPNAEALSEKHPWIVQRTLEGMTLTNIAKEEDLQQAKGKVLEKYTLPQLSKLTCRIFDKHVKNFHQNVKAFEKALDRIDENDIDLRIYGESLMQRIGYFYNNELEEFEKAYDVLGNMARRALNKRRIEKVEGVWKKITHFFWRLFCDQTVRIESYKTRINTLKVEKKDNHYDKLLGKVYALITRYKANLKKDIDELEKTVCREKNDALVKILDALLTYAPPSLAQNYHDQHSKIISDPGQSRNTNANSPNE